MAITDKFFQYSREFVFEINLLKALMGDIMFKQFSFRSFARAYNYMWYAESKNFELIQMQPKRLQLQRLFTYQSHH